MADARRCIALLRGINVGGNNRVPMAELREVLGAVGMREVRTLIQSGNVVFESDEQSAGELEELLEAAVADRFGLRIAIMVRTAAEWHALVAENPFAEEAAAEGNKVFVHCFKAEVDAGVVAEFVAGYAGPERLVAAGREIYVHYPGGIGRSELKAKFLTGGTARNWNTVTKLKAMLG